MAKLLGLHDIAIKIVDLIPKELLDQDLSFDQFNDFVRYNYGEPYKYNERPFAYGTPQMPYLKHFTLAYCMSSYILSSRDFNDYLKYIFNPEKHSDALLEIRPLLNSELPNKVFHEFPGLGEKTIDWRIVYPDIEILLEVKNRSGSTFEHLLQIAKSKGSVVTPDTNPEKIFKSTFSKFCINNNNSVLQGIWINFGIKESKSLLDNYFENEINPELLQFYIIAGWGKEGYIKTRKEEQKTILIKKFGLIESDKFVF
jgi:hypothetical protein